MWCVKRRRKIDQNTQMLNVKDLCGFLLSGFFRSFFSSKGELQVMDCRRYTRLNSYHMNSFSRMRRTSPT